MTTNVAIARGSLTQFHTSCFITCDTSVVLPVDATIRRLMGNPTLEGINVHPRGITFYCARGRSRDLIRQVLTVLRAYIGEIMEVDMGWLYGAVPDDEPDNKPPA